MIIELNSILALFKMAFAHSTHYVYYWEALLSSDHKQISLLQTHPSGISLEIKTVDNQVVTVKMQQPLHEPVIGLVEFHGTVQGKNTVSSDFYLSFPPEFNKNFG